MQRKTTKPILNDLEINKSKRPLIKNIENEELTEFIAKHLFDRSFYYNHCKHTIMIDDKSPFDVIEEIQKILL